MESRHKCRHCNYFGGNRLMSVPLSVQGVTFQYPQQFDKNWGPVLTNWSTAVTNAIAPLYGGTFAPIATIDFGSSFGIKALSLTSHDANPAATGFIRMGNADAGLV